MGEDDDCENLLQTKQKDAQYLSETNTNDDNEKSAPCTTTARAVATKTSIVTNKCDEGHEENNRADSKKNNDSTEASSTASTTTATVLSKIDRHAVNPMSKSQQKKRKRYEKLMAIKKRRKQQDKDAKIAKAKAEGRDLDAERKLQEERTKSGEGHRKREEKWQERIKKADSCFKVCIDCSFEELMTSKEIKSLSNQVRYCYAVNKSSYNSVHLSVSSLSGATYENLTKVCGFPDQWRAFSYSEKPLLNMHAEKSDIVYLTSDSDHTLENLDDTKTYVIGGIVDRNRLKGLTTTRAKEMGIATARLPIDRHLHLCATKVLTCNHVFEILLKYRERDNNWKEALLEVLPARKDITGVPE